MNSRRAVPGLVSLVAVAALLTACSSAESDGASSATPSASATSATATASASASASAGPSETPSATPTASEAADRGETVTQTCDDLISAQQIYDYNSNFSVDDSWTPAAGSRAATAVDYRGVACSWINDSSSERISLGVAHLRDDTLESIEAERASGTKTAWGYFTVDGSTGRADAFTDDYWITIDSKTFFEADDAAPLVEDVVAALG